MTAAAVADASPLIALQQIGQLELLRALFGQVTIPQAVAREVRQTVPATSWIVERALSQPTARSAQRAALGPGEREALSLALELGAAHLVVDEKAARQAALALGLNVVETVGVLLAAKRKGLIPNVRPLLDDLVRQSFWIAPRLIEQALLAAGEA